MPKIWHAVLVVLEFCDKLICFIIYERQEYKNEIILKLKIINHNIVWIFFSTILSVHVFFLLLNKRVICINCLYIFAHVH